MAERRRLPLVGRRQSVSGEGERRRREYRARRKRGLDKIPTSISLPTAVKGLVADSERKQTLNL